MRSLTRRETLAVATGGIALFAGCSGTEERVRDPPGSTRESIEYDAIRVRTGAVTKLFWTDSNRTTDPDSQRDRFEGEYIATQEDFDELEFASTDGGERLASFAKETDFDSRSVLLQSMGVLDCYEIKLSTVTVDRKDQSPHIDFCRTTKPADYDCAEEKMQTVGFAVRLYQDGERVHSHGSGTSNSCALPPETNTFDTTVTVQGEKDE